jgi:hypothetical protein
MVVRGSGYATLAVGAEVDADHGVVPREPWRKESPHQAGPRKAVNHEDGRALSITSTKDFVSGNVDLGLLERNVALRLGKTC